MRRAPVLLMALTLPLLLAGCSEPVDATPAFTPSAAPSATPSTTAAGTAAGAAAGWDVGAGCAAVSAVATTVATATADRADKRITKAQRNAILSSAGPSFRLVQAGLGASSPLSPAVDAIVALMPATPKATRAGFDPGSLAYSVELHRIADVCAANGTDLTGSLGD